MLLPFKLLPQGYTGPENTNSRSVITTKDANGRNPERLCWTGNGLELQKPWIHETLEEHQPRKSFSCPLSLIPPINFQEESKTTIQQKH